jgi:hypothetical protein
MKIVLLNRNALVTHMTKQFVCVILIEQIGVVVMLWTCIQEAWSSNLGKLSGCLY